jgi:hypothetical protein
MGSATLKRTDLVLPQLPARWQLVTAAVLANGNIALLATNVDLAQEWRRDANGLVLGKPGEVAAYAEARVWCFDGEGLVDGPSFRLETRFLEIDRFDDGRWLVVANRTGGDPNARVLAPDGQLLARFMLGDGVRHVGVDQCDQIWVGWFDEGIFGNHEWRVPDEEWPPSSQGVGLFLADGKYQQLSAFPDEVEAIADCYALNILGEGVWACPYVDFPLLHLRAGRSVRWWSNELAGPKALAVFENHVLLAGGYSADADRLALVALDGEGNGNAAQVLAVWRLPLVPRIPPRGEHPDCAARHPWQQPTLLTGRRDVIHLIENGVWHRWRVSDALIAANSMANQ